MSHERVKELDVNATKVHILALSSNKNYFPISDDAGCNWLGHSGATSTMDACLLFRSSMPELMQKSGKTNAAIWNHFRHLRDEHGLNVATIKGVYFFKLK